MAVNITSYGGLLNGTLSWLGRASPGEAIITPRFDDILLLAERRIYYGYATEDVGNPLRSDPLRIPEMEVVDPAFLMAGDVDIASARLTEDDEPIVRVIEAAEGTTEITTIAGTVGQPDGFLELISAVNNNDDLPIAIVAQRVIDGFGRGAMGRVGLMAVSGMNFRFLDAPTSGTATLRYYQKLETPAGSTSNDILDGYPDVYLYACLIEACIFTQDEASAQRYLAMYSTSVQGLNARRQRITASSVPVMRLRAGLAP